MSDTPPSEDRRFKTKQVLTLAGAHLVHDVFTAFLAPLLPLLIDRLHLTLLQAGVLMLMLQLPSMLNPLFGALVDRGGFTRLVVVVTPAISGVGICLMGLAPSYGALCVILLTVGFSLAGLHVAAPVIVARAAGDRVGRGMSFFMFGGELARTIGPLLAVQLVSWLTLEGMWRLFPVSLVASLVLWWRVSKIPIVRAAEQPTNLFALWKRMRKVIVGLMGVVIARSFMTAAMVTFLPTYFYRQGETLFYANAALTVLELAGSGGVLTSGTLSDWLGRRRVLAAGIALSPLVMLLFLAVDGPLIWPVLALLGFVTLSTTPVLMAVMIESAGGDRAAANGTYMMISFALRSAVIPAVGAIGDAIGLRDTYLVCACAAFVGLPFVLLFPKKR
ncbi:MAG: MFS transporter [Deltaproteobacteria bacterium]|nr:MFS transporter [Deltaproteobacteria bacterium]